MSNDQKENSSNLVNVTDLNSTREIVTPAIDSKYVVDPETTASNTATPNTTAVSISKDSKMDPLFLPETRNAALPILYPTIYEQLLKQRGCFWQTHEVPLDKDLADWAILTADEKHFIKHILAFFATSDLIVTENLEERFLDDIKIIEVRMMYRFQEVMEDIHSEMYALLIDTYISDLEEKNKLFNAVREIPVIKKKAEWAKKWINSTNPYCHRLIAFATVEGILFSGSFCAIYWLKNRGLLPGFTFSNDFISRDEGLHVEGALTIHNLLYEKADQKIAHEITREAVELEIEFITEALPCRLIGINAGNMKEYIKYVANGQLKLFGYSEIYPNVAQPFPFMDLIRLDSKANFFEKNSSQYKATAPVNSDANIDPYADLL